MLLEETCKPVEVASTSEQIVVPPVERDVGGFGDVGDIGIHGAEGVHQFHLDFSICDPGFVEHD